MLLSRLASDIWTLFPVLAPEECRHLIARAEEYGFDTAAVRLPTGPQIVSGIRNNDRVALDDPDLARLLWERVREHVSEEVDGSRAVGLLDHFRFYRYDPGQRFKRHRDGIETGPNGARSRFTFLVYLNDGCEGGETVFSDYVYEDGERVLQELRIVPETGLGLFFAHERWHEGRPLLAGRKYVLRSDVLYAAPQAGVPADD
ncbi:MAG: putative iron-regulated protein [Armatimonadetes bacterium]|nr:putative iron-regulated protein [Armatimonadota bacterium]